MRRAIVALKAKRKEHGQHPGLLLQRFLCEPATGVGGNPDERRAILHAAIAAAKNESVRALYKSAFARWSADLLTRSSFVDLCTAGRMIIGLGSENVLETGIRLHHTFGMPIIPGSALKGLAAHYCYQVWGSDNSPFRKPTEQEEEAYSAYLKGQGPTPAENYHRVFFGSTDDSGCVVFHDAWYVPDSSPQPLVLDVMTPHHPQWLDGSAPPTDFDSPIPVPFLSVTGTFRVAVSWNGPSHPHAHCWTEGALSLLKKALADWGIGGKTSSGYGRLVLIDADVNVRPSEPGEKRVQPNEPVHQPRMKVRVVQRTIDGKTRYEADDGFLGSLLKGTPPDLVDGDSTELWILRVDKQNKKVPYVFQTEEPPAPKPPPSKTERRGNRRDRQ
ncbi:MAG: type III-B CRISPR module RAMP protein Cmr6 [Isosphaeraceae bacterium]|jgi:CRISPR-associated protein Cmr6|nr:MAG: type III-B CRISPR module RAMP protein Cmr6 [Isosphaeraceae bacterium]